MDIDDNMKIVKDNQEVRQIRLNNIKLTQFVIPNKEATIEEVTLTDCIPFVNPDQPRKELFLHQNAQRAK